MAMTSFNQQLYRDFLKLVERQFALGDFDAEHPTWVWLINKHKLSIVEGMWLSFLYMAFYDEASAWVVFRNSDPFTVPKNVEFPIGTNRRNLYGGRVVDHFEALKAARISAKRWPCHNLTGDKAADWKLLKDSIRSVWGNGRFASYTTAEMLQKVNNVDVEITDFENRSSSGPADGVHRIIGCGRKDIPALDSGAERIYGLVVKSGMKPFYTGVDRGVIESVLCNLSGICRGRFYSGRNLDRQQARILRVEAMGHDLKELWEARHAVFDHQFLGEFNGWVGIDKERLDKYRYYKEIPWTYEGR